MLTRSRPADARPLPPRHIPIPTSKATESQPGQGFSPVNLVGLMCTCLTVFVLGVVTVARTGELPQMPNLPEYLLPGHPLPQNVVCYTLSDEPMPRCSVDVAGNRYYFEFEAGTRTITRTLLPAQAYTIGDMILAWGAPTGITQRDAMIYVHWRARSALLYTSEFRPDSRAELILYDLEPLPASPWRGFQLHRRAGM